MAPRRQRRPPAPRRLARRRIGGAPDPPSARRARAGAAGGEDLGPGVERIFGASFTEYEWAWVVGPDAVPATVAALDGDEGDDPLRLLAAWSAAHSGIDPGSRLREAGVPIEFWNRIGD